MSFPEINFSTMTLTRHLFLLCFLLPLGLFAQQAGDLDTDFGTNGTQSLPINSFGEEIKGRVISDLGSDNTIFIALLVEQNLQNRIVVAGYKADGKVLKTFADGGQAIIDPGEKVLDLASMKVLPDGGILLLGTSENTNPTAGEDIFLMKLDAEGNPDAAFGNAGEAIFSTTANEGGVEVELLPDGQFYVSGRILPGRFGYREAILLRFAADGTLDNTFGTDGLVYPGNGGSDENTFCMGRFPNGNIILGGVRNVWTEPTWYAIAHGIRPSGEYVRAPRYYPYFGSTYGSYGGLEITCDGDVCLGGTVTGSNFSGGREAPQMFIQRADSLGNADSSFAENGVALLLGGQDSIPNFGAMTVLTDGSVVALANWEMSDAVIHTSLYKVDSTGLGDPSFGNNPMGIAGLAWFASGSLSNADGLRFGELHLQSSGRLIAIGQNEQEVRIAGFFHPGPEEAGIDKVYPNPLAVGDRLTVELTGLTGAVDYSLVDLRGKVLFQWPTVTTPKQHQLQIPDYLREGLYFLRLQQGDIVSVRKLLLRRR